MLTKKCLFGQHLTVPFRHHSTPEPQQGYVAFMAKSLTIYSLVSNFVQICLHMKKLFSTLLLLTIALMANAQFHLGGQFSVNFSNEHTEYSSGYTQDVEHAYLVDLLPKMYWNLNEKMQIGGRIGFAFGRLNSGYIFDPDLDPLYSVYRAVGWSVSPFFGYKLLNWKIVSVWCEANVFLSKYYNTDKKKAEYEEWSTDTEYGFQILPVINVDITETMAIQLHVGVASIGWCGSRADYPSKVVTTSTWDIHKGGIYGLIQGISKYGIGIVRKF